MQKRNYRLVGVTLGVGLLCAGALASLPAADTGDAWAKVTETDTRILIQTDKLEAAIPKKNPKQWMTGVEKQSFLD